MSEQIIPSKYENAIRHAIATFNNPLLNRLELELIRIFEIKPFDASSTHFETFEINCPLAKYNDEQRKLKASKVAA
jgi:hypothetical protein